VAKNTFLVTTTKISLIHVLSPFEQTTTSNSESSCKLRWKLGKLFVSQDTHKNINLGPLENLQWLTNCLNHSSTQAVCIDLELENNVIELWATACKESKKPIFIKVPPISSTPPQALAPFRWMVKRVVDRLIAALLIIFTSPLIILVISLIRVKSNKPIFSYQWCVGRRGRLFRTIRFRIVSEHLENKYNQITKSLNESSNLLDDSPISRLGYWIRRYDLDLLIQLVNVLQGDMSIMGPRVLNLNEAKQIDIIHRSCLRALPGIINYSPKFKA
jgi:lipopolysaccharide/colanic/teichoic acid biosynthesis glycosyltransferase